MIIHILDSLYIGNVGFPNNMIIWSPILVEEYNRLFLTYMPDTPKSWSKFTGLNCHFLWSLIIALAQHQGQTCPKHHLHVMKSSIRICLVVTREKDGMEEDR